MKSVILVYHKLESVVPVQQKINPKAPTPQNVQTHLSNS